MKKFKKGSITIDVLIAGMVLTAGIAASMYLFNLGFQYLEKANTINAIALKVSQTPALLRTLDFSKESGTEDLGEGVTLEWTSKLIAKSKPERLAEVKISSMYELYLYEVTLKFKYKDLIKTYKINVFRSKAVVSPEEIGI
ncbi:MAG: hypothetical protein DRP29_01310 [Thermodesulfobacteriota bacterium]|nr:MAG: hypothetical protein DRP29_01310 [Thermodesulfobacteriota bacterium]